MTVPPEIEAQIADAPLSVHLATSVGDRPHVAPVWYVYENSEVYRAAGDGDEGALAERVWILTGGKKLQNVRRNPRVALSIERADASGVDWAVQLLGTARIVDDGAQVERIEAAMDRKYGANGSEDESVETDGGSEESAESSNEVGEEWALLAVRVGSATIQRYG